MQFAFCPSGTVICELSCSINLCSVLLSSEVGGEKTKQSSRITR